MTHADIPRVRTELQVMFFDTDCGGVVHNIAYLRFIEVARTLLAEKLGLPLTDMAESKRYPVVVRTEIDYRRGAKLGDQLVVEGWLDRLERVRFWCAFRITRPSDDALIAESRQMLALIQMPEAKLLRLPDSWERYREQLSRNGDFQVADPPRRRSGEHRSLAARERTATKRTANSR
jgi:YbgC/YbaW family acyl-CoA thioester hydrolase